MILVPDKKFKKAFKRLINKNPQLQKKVLTVLETLEKDPFTPSLKSHKLTGNSLFTAIVHHLIISIIVKTITQ